MEVALPVYVPLALLAGYDCACLPVRDGTVPPVADFRWSQVARHGGSCAKGWEVNGRTCRAQADNGKVRCLLAREEQGSATCRGYPGAVLSGHSEGAH